MSAEHTAQDIARGFDLTGRTVLITGASSGLGAETARALALTGADLVITGRNRAALGVVAAELQLGAGARCEALTVDQSDLASVEDLARSVAALAPAIDVLICNAGVSQTAEDRAGNGLDMRCVTNHLSHVLLAHRLLGPLAARRARIVVLGSAGHKGRPVDLADIGWRDREIDHRVAYGESKSANALFAVEASRRWRHLGICANTVQPGAVMTGLQRFHSPERLREMAALGGIGQADSVFTSAALGAATTVWAALAPELDGVGGAVLENCRRAELAGPDTHLWLGYTAHATDPATARALWTVTAGLLAELGHALDLPAT